jgi:hypothetical protein
MRCVVQMTVLGVAMVLSCAVSYAQSSTVKKPTSCKAMSQAPAVCPLAWGGPGHDHARTRGPRFQVCCAGPDIALHVDTPETVDSVGSMSLVSKDGRSITSRRCHKASRHKSAPWLCAWPLAELAPLAGVGKLVVNNHSGHAILQVVLDLSDLARLAE